jgi:FMN phosphatase YigB (HAD superfamily)
MTSVPYEILNSEFTLKSVKALIFDLDDTLYFIPSGAQFLRYGEHLSEFLSEPQKEAYLNEFKKTVENDSPLKVGRAYDPETSWILEFDDHWGIQNAYQLDGALVPMETMRKHYPEGSSMDLFPNLIHLSSGWGVPSAVGRMFGLTREHFRSAYLATREDMVKHPEEFPLVVPAEIQSFFKRCYDQGYRLMIMTNSGLGEAEEVLTRIGISSFFCSIYPEARKPNYSFKIFQEIVEKNDLDYSNLLVIGDSVYNDLRQAKSLDAQTVLIERFPDQPLGMVDVRVWDMEGFIQLWEKLSSQF